MVISRATKAGVRERAVSAAETALADQRYVSPIDVLARMGWLAWPHVEAWRKGRIATIEETIQVNPQKVLSALTAMREWADAKGLEPSETPISAATARTPSISALPAPAAPR